MSADPYSVSWGTPPWVRERGRRRRPGVLIAAMVVGVALCTLLVGSAVLFGASSARSVPGSGPVLDLPITGPVLVNGPPTPGELLADLIAADGRR